MHAIAYTTATPRLEWEAEVLAHNLKSVDYHDIIVLFCDGDPEIAKEFEGKSGGAQWVIDSPATGWESHDILHNARVGDSSSGLFYKEAWADKSPLHAEIPADKNYCSCFYVKAVRAAAEAAETGKATAVEQA